MLSVFPYTYWPFVCPSLILESGYVAFFFGYEKWKCLLLSWVWLFAAPCTVAHQALLSFCSWDFPGKNTGVGSHSNLQGIFPTQELSLGLLHTGRFFAVWAIRDAVKLYGSFLIWYCPTSQLHISKSKVGTNPAPTHSLLYFSVLLPPPKKYSLVVTVLKIGPTIICRI